MGNGGVGGTGLGYDHYAALIPELTSDMIFAAIGTEMGLVGAVAVVMAFILLVGAGFRVAQTARSDFSRLMATGLTLIIGFQAFFIMAGVVRILPFTGITLALRRLRRVVAAGELHPHRADAADLRRRCPRTDGDVGRGCGRRAGRTPDGPGAR